MNEPFSSLADDVATWLTDGAVDAVSCPWLPAVSIFVDEFYENFDYELIGPTDRLRIAKVLGQHGFKQRTGRTFDGPNGRIEFPQTTRTLASDPAHELESTLDRGSGLAFATPTQVVLATWRREGPELGEPRLADLHELLRRQPANLDKISDWLRRSDARAAYVRAHPSLKAAQEEGTRQRRGNRGSR
jgi:hypothetical protein